MIARLMHVTHFHMRLHIQTKMHADWISSVLAFFFPEKWSQSVCFDGPFCLTTLNSTLPSMVTSVAWTQCYFVKLLSKCKHAVCFPTGCCLGRAHARLRQIFSTIATDVNIQGKEHTAYIHKPNYITWSGLATISVWQGGINKKIGLSHMEIRVVCLQSEYGKWWWCVEGGTGKWRRPIC